MCDRERVEHSAEDAEHDGDIRKPAAACVRQVVHRTVDRCDIENVAVILAVYDLAVIGREGLFPPLQEVCRYTAALPAERSRQVLLSL